jgi:hypothetical protein
MTWVRIDDKAWRHPKIAALSPSALRLWLFALCWCNQYETDGAIPAHALTLLESNKARAAELVSAGLWEKTQTGWQVHDYLVYQPSRAKLDNERTATKHRVNQHRERKRNAVTCSAVTEKKRTRNTRPDPDPDPDLPVKLSPRLQTSFQPKRASPDADDTSIGEVTHEPSPPEPAAHLEVTDDRETPIPMDFKTRFPSSAIDELAAGYGVTRAAVESELHEFTTYWTIGAGAGKRRRNWPAQFRRRVQTRAQAGELGAVASPKGPANPAKTQPRDLYRQPPAKDWQKWVCAMRADETWDEYLVRFAKHQETYVVK